MIARLKEQVHKHKTQEQLLISARQKEEKLSQDVNLLKEELLQATRGHTPVSTYVRMHSKNQALTSYRDHVPVQVFIYHGILTQLSHIANCTCVLPKVNGIQENTL